jgi:hypothetical protein
MNDLPVPGKVRNQDLLLKSELLTWGTLNETNSLSESLDQ